MKILIHPSTLAYEPILEGGTMIEGKNHTELVEAMQNLTPFTMVKSTRNYMRKILKRIGGDNQKLPTKDMESAAAHFFTILAQNKLIEFLPENAFIEDPFIDDAKKKGDKCADK